VVRIRENAAGHLHALTPGMGCFLDEIDRAARGFGSLAA